MRGKLLSRHRAFDGFYTLVERFPLNLAFSLGRRNQPNMLATIRRFCPGRVGPSNCGDGLDCPPTQRPGNPGNWASTLM